MIWAGMARRGGMLPAGGRRGGGEQPVSGVQDGPRRAPSADATHVGAAVPVAALIPSQQAQPTAPFPYLATLTEHHDRRSVMRVCGELDVASQANLRHAIAVTLSRHSPRLLVLDLSKLSFIDCTGLRVIMWAHQRQAEQGRKLVITNVQPRVRRVLHLTSCDTVLRLSPA